MLKEKEREREKNVIHVTENVNVEQKTVNVG